MSDKGGRPKKLKMSLTQNIESYDECKFKRKYVLRDISVNLNVYLQLTSCPTMQMLRKCLKCFRTLEVNFRSNSCAGLPLKADGAKLQTQGN